MCWQASVWSGCWPHGHRRLNGKQRLKLVIGAFRDVERPHFPLHLVPDLRGGLRTWKRRFSRLEEEPSAIRVVGHGNLQHKPGLRQFSTETQATGKGAG